MGGAKKYKVPIWLKLNLTVEEAAEYSGLGEKLIRERAKSPECPFALWHGTHLLIKRKEFEEYNSKVINF